MTNSKFRIERDSMGEVHVPADALYGAQTQRAVINFPISGFRFPRELIRALGIVKMAAAEANRTLGLLDTERTGAIVEAAREVIDGTLDNHFVVDVFQTGSGTSSNMNANEVIANRAIELMGGRIGSKAPVHPNDHVNLGQSSNDVIPTSIHVAALESINGSLIPSMEHLERSLAEKAAGFDDVVKVGRTHLQDATPVRLGQEFSGYRRQIQLGVQRLRQLGSLSELALGGTAVGTGINTHPRFANEAIQRISTETGIRFIEAVDHFEAAGARDAVVEASGVLKTIAVGMMKIANDIRWLGSGPRCGLGEIVLPETQPGSSIMPGKVNPVIAESVCQVAAQVMGNDIAITVGGQAGNLELNVMMPVMAHNLLQSIRLLSASSMNFANRCVTGITADRDRAGAMAGRSLAMGTALVPILGYDEAAEIAKEAHRTGKNIGDVARERNVAPADQLESLLDPRDLTGPR